MEFRVLGPVEARGDGGRIALSGSKMHTVLAAMLLAPGQMVSDSRLSSLLWGWDPPATASAQIYTYMSRLRGLLGAEVAIVRRQPGYLLVARDSRVDLMEFERLERQGQEALRRQEYATAAGLLHEALELWHGPALANVTEFMRDRELAPLEETRILALENRIEADLALGRHERVTGELTAAVAQHPTRERLRAQLMTALYRCGRQADALSTYHEGRKVLAEQLGVDPGIALGATYHAVLGGELGLESPPPIGMAPAGRGSGAGSWAAPSAGTGGDPVTPPAMLPPDIDDFTGRRSELTVLGSMISAAADSSGGEGGTSHPRRFLLTGMAGIGKSALAVRAAHAHAWRYPDGQLYADLCRPDGTPREPGEVLGRLLRALGESGPESGAVADDLEELVRRYRNRTAGRRLLIVLDNAADDVQLWPLLPGSAEATVLVTCRTQLTHVAGSYSLGLGPLNDGDALTLLSSAAGRPSAGGAADAFDDLVAYCAGLPLALRVTGTRLAARPHWSAARLAARLAEPRFRLDELHYGNLSVRDALWSSVLLLDGRGREALAALAGVGADPFSAQRAGELFGVGADEAERGLESLVDAALLDICGVDATGRPLYRCHELVRLLAMAPETESVLRGPGRGTRPEAGAGCSPARPVPREGLAASPAG